LISLKICLQFFNSRFITFFMSLVQPTYESAHPLGQELEQIQGAVSAGMADTPDFLPSHIKLNYEDPITSGVGVGTLRVADWQRESVTDIIYPIVVDPEDPEWIVSFGQDIFRVRQKIFSKDLLGRGFPVTIDGEQIVTPYMRFDLIDPGIVFTAEHNQSTRSYLGQFDSQTYGTFAHIARRHASVMEVTELAVRF
jgi:hypothetical protein